MQKFLDAGGFKIAYTEQGPPDGRVVFCVHGLLSNSRDYDFLGAALAKQGFRFIAMDLPGRGKSDWFADGAQYSLPYYIPYCSALASHITQGKPFDWLGVSLGGMLGMALTRAEGLSMERLILVDIGAEISGAALDAVSKLAKAPALYPSKALAVGFLRARCTAWGIKEEATWNHLIAHNIIEDQGGYRLHCDHKIGAALKDHNETLSFWEGWEAITQRVFLVRGSLSPFVTSAIAEQMAARYTGPRMDVLVFPECGHVPNLMEEEQIRKLAAWLGGNES